MLDIDLGVTTNFAPRRWPSVKQWIEIIHGKLEMELCELSLDLLDPFTREPTKTAMIQEIVESCDDYEVQIYSTHTGNSVKNSNLFFHPDLGMRLNTIEWFENAIDITAGIDAVATGGYIGTMTEDFNRNQKKSHYLLDFAEDCLVYLSNLSYEAGLNCFLWELLPSLLNQFKIEQIIAVLDNINSISKAPTKIALNISDQSDLKTMAELSDYLGLIHIDNADNIGRILNIFSNIDSKNQVKHVPIMVNYLPNKKTDSEEILRDLKNIIAQLKSNIK
ncbi:MAG: hypothetical protein GF364_14480 [Candidatus Lokiarchaeota archaeon]|nr:hypothetical protein [Candidatus Lokiarchaeota archaeon]